ncbi:MAG: hypothetical protein AB1637_05205 [Elusimicrobiota bacterium]
MIHGEHTKNKSPKILLTSVMRPLGPSYGDAQSVGYELLHAQVTREQGMFSPRAVHRQFSLDYIAENLDNPVTVLHYPSKKELIKELKNGYDYVGISFIMVTYHRMKEVSYLIRKYSPKSKIILGGFGTVLPDEALTPYGDYICRGDGIAFMRELLRQPKIENYKHPVIESRLKVFSKTISYTGMIFAGLGCPNGCDFCSTSHFFSRKHVKLLKTGKDIYEVVKKHLEINPDAQFTILDEEFLLDTKRAEEFRQCVLEGGKPLSIFVFASLKALSLYSPQTLLEMGIDGVWIGYEGEKSGYEKRAGKSAKEIFKSLKENGIMILASMIVGFDYQDEEVIKQELNNLLSMNPDLCQFMIYNPNPGTPLYERVKKEGLLRDFYKENPKAYWKWASGFKSLLKHPKMTASQIEKMQKYCYETDFKRLGPSIYRVADTMINGYVKHKDSENPMLRAKAEKFAKELKNSYPVFLPGELFSPGIRARVKVMKIRRRLYKTLGNPSFSQRIMSLAAVAAALWTSFKLRFNLFQHPSLYRKTWNFPPEAWSYEWLKERINSQELENFKIKLMEYKDRKLVHIRFEGNLYKEKAERLAADLKNYLDKNKAKLRLDFEKLKLAEKEALESFVRELKEYRERIEISLPKNIASNSAGFLFVAEIFKIVRN